MYLNTSARYFISQESEIIKYESLSINFSHKMNLLLKLDTENFMDKKTLHINANHLSFNKHLSNIT